MALSTKSSESGTCSPGTKDICGGRTPKSSNMASGPIFGKMIKGVFQYPGTRTRLDSLNGDFEMDSLRQLYQQIGERQPACQLLGVRQAAAQYGSNALLLFRKKRLVVRLQGRKVKLAQLIGATSQSR